MDGIDEFHAAELEGVASAVVEWMALLQALVAEPHRNLVIGDNGCAGAFGDVRRIGQMVSVPVRDQDVIRHYLIHINISGQIVARDERIEQQSFARDVRRKARVAVVSNFHSNLNLTLSLNLNLLALLKKTHILCAEANGFWGQVNSTFPALIPNGSELI